MWDATLPQWGQNALAYAAFALYTLLVLAGGLTAVLSRNLVRALMGLVVTFLGVAGMYLLMAAPFMAFMQLLIYIGAIAVLIFFAVMLVDNTAAGEEASLPGPVSAATALAAAGASFLLFGFLVAKDAGRLQEVATPAETPLAELGQGLLGYYVLPFEMISVVLLVAMAGGVLLAWDKRFRR